MLTLVLAYFENPSMLAAHYQRWAEEWTDEHRQRVRVVVVDDGSPTHPAVDVPRPAGLPELRIYRVAVDLPWHQDAARNIGAHEAEDGWLLLTDMDHGVPATTLDRLFQVEDRGCFYTLGRIEADTGQPTLDKRGRPKPHPNSYLMTRELYWRAGGYDEDYTGVYGTDGMFRRQLLAVAPHAHLADAPLARYSRLLIEDASTNRYCRQRHGGTAAKARVLARKRKLGRENLIATLECEWTRVL